MALGLFRLLSPLVRRFQGSAPEVSRPPRGWTARRNLSAAVCGALLAAGINPAVVAALHGTDAGAVQRQMRPTSAHHLFVDDMRMGLAANATSQATAVATADRICDAGTQDIYDGVNSKAARKTLPPKCWPIAQRKLDAVVHAGTLDDLRSNGNNLEKLKGDLAGAYSIRINGQYRIVFDWTAEGAQNVRIVDYH